MSRFARLLFDLPFLGPKAAIYLDGVGAFREYARRAQSGLVAIPMSGRFHYLANQPDVIAELLKLDMETIGRGGRTAFLRSVVGAGLLTSNDEPWARDRRRLQPLFSVACVAGWQPVIAAQVNAAIDRLALEGGAADFHRVSNHLVQSVTGDVFFGDLLDTAEKDALRQALQAINKNAYDEWLRLHFLRGPLLRLQTPGRRHAAAERARYRELVRTAIARAQTRSQQPAALALEIYDALDGDEDPIDRLCDHITTLNFAGQATTARFLVWLAEKCGRAPAWFADIRAESAALGTLPVTHRHGYAQHFPKTTAIINETLRLNSPSHSADREVRREVALSTGESVRPRCPITISIMNTHRDPDYWQDPDQFDPERFLGPRDQGAHPCAFMPFGHGRHKCIGEMLALAQIYTFILTLARRGSITIENKKPLQPRMRMSLEASAPLRVRFTPHTE